MIIVDIIAIADICAESVGVTVKSIEATSKEELRDIVGVVLSVEGITCIGIIGIAEGPTIEAPAFDKAALKALMMPLAFTAIIEDELLGTMVIVG